MNPSGDKNQPLPAANPTPVPDAQTIEGIQPTGDASGNNLSPVAPQPNHPTSVSAAQKIPATDTRSFSTLSASPAQDNSMPNMPPPGPPPNSTPEQKSSSWKSALPTILLFILAPAIAWSITYFGFQSYQVDGQSMETTLQNKDRLVVSKVARSWSKVTHHPYIPARGNIIIFNQAGLFDGGSNQDKQLIKRVIGLPGERVIVKDNQITIYNDQHPGGFNPDRTTGYTITATTTPGDVDVTLKDNEIFVCGDNRTNSEDSRYFGPVNVNRIVGKLSFRILPLNKAERF